MDGFLDQLVEAWKATGRAANKGIEQKNTRDGHPYHDYYFHRTYQTRKYHIHVYKLNATGQYVYALRCPHPDESRGVISKLADVAVPNVMDSAIAEFTGALAHYQGECSQALYPDQKDALPSSQDYLAEYHRAMEQHGLAPPIYKPAWEERANLYLSYYHYARQQGRGRTRRIKKRKTKKTSKTGLRRR